MIAVMSAPCSEELHQLNRRTEMMVVEVKK
jgi:hypothetical protein